MKSKMKKSWSKLWSMALTLAVLGLSTSVLAADSHYEIRADGLACPYCAYGIEKSFMAIDGVKYVDVKLKKGLVLVTGDKKLALEEPQLKTLFNDAGFTYRSMKKTTEKK